MNRYYILLLISLFSVLSIVAQQPTLTGRVTDTNKEPLIGANIYWANTSDGVSTDADGNFSIPYRSSHRLVVSYTGYQSDTLTVNDSFTPLLVVLDGAINLSEVLVGGRAVGTIHSRVEPIQTQKITFAELCRAACCNLGESFETNPSVDVSYSDAVTGARQIQLLGLSGKYVQMLTENIPNFRGASSSFGLSYVPGTWMESIQVSKGTSSVKNGYEALTGQINVEYKKPQTADPLSVNLFASDAQRLEANVDGHYEFSPSVGGSLMLHYSNDTKKHDANGDGFLDQPLTKQFNVINRWYFRHGHYSGQAGVKFLNESRENGQAFVPAGADKYSIGINTNRGEVFTKQAYIIDTTKNHSVALIANWSIHDQKSVYGRRNYDVQQQNLYLSLLYENEFTPVHSLSTGLSLNIDRTDEVFKTSVAKPNEYQPFNNLRNEVVPGIYGQYTFKPSDKFIALAGLRADHHNQYGSFVTPRLHLKYNPNEHIHLRASVGKGYRSVNVWAENNSLFASNRVGQILEPLKMENAINYGLNATFFIHIGSRELTLNGEWYYTNFIDQVVADMDANPHSVLFYNLNGRSYASSVQVEASYPFFRGFTLTAAYRWTDTQTTYQGLLREKPLTNRSKGLITASYQTPLQKWQFDYTVQFNGGGRMPDPDKVNPMWDAEFSPFTLMNAQVTRFFKNWSVYMGAENITNYKQKMPIIDAQNPFGDNFDATMVYAPMHGRKFYVGVRWNIPRPL